MILDIRSFAAAADCCCMDLPAVGIQYSSLRAAGTGTVYYVSTSREQVAALNTY